LILRRLEKKQMPIKLFLKIMKELPGMTRSDRQAARGNQGQNLWPNTKLLALSSLLMATLLLSAFFATAAKALGQQDQKNDGRGSTDIEDPVRREEAISGMHVVQNGCAEMQASGTRRNGMAERSP
jgi:hypothetical protein